MTKSDNKIKGSLMAIVTAGLSVGPSLFGHAAYQAIQRGELMDAAAYAATTALFLLPPLYTLSRTIDYFVRRDED